MTGQRLRVFVALVLPSQVTRALVAWREEALWSMAALRPVDPKHLHVTLCFLGWQTAEAVHQIAAACLEVSSAAPPPELVLGQPVWLPPRRPSVLAIELDDAAGGLAHLQSALSAALQAGGWYVPERRPYLGHVTVARVRRGVPIRAEACSTPPEISFTGSEVAVFRSVLSPGGAHYEALARLELG